MKVLILGGTGAMGSALVNILAERGHEVFVTSRAKRDSDYENVRYLNGDAHNNDFLNSILKNKYTAVVDFMVYTPDEFVQRMERLLSSTEQYFFLSSSRVYANSKSPLQESSSRLLDKCDDLEYLQTDEYALAKARAENMLAKSGQKNWTIIRPYITYSDNRIQLGIYEKEQWLFRALQGKTIVFARDIAAKKTTLTDGRDVAAAMADLIGCEKAFGEIFHIVADKAMNWGGILAIYCETIERITGNMPKILMKERFEDIAKVMGAEYQLKYDRLYNRIFDNSKIGEIVNNSGKYIPMDKGLVTALTSFIKGKREFRNIDWWLEGYLDKLTCERTAISVIPGMKNKVKYFVGRYTFLRTYKSCIGKIYKAIKQWNIS